MTFCHYFCLYLTCLSVSYPVQTPSVLLAAEKNRGKGERKGLSREIRSREHPLHSWNGGDRQDSKKKKAGMGASYLSDTVGEGRLSPL